MKKEKIQYIFIGIISLVLFSIIILLIIYFISDYKRWQNYRNDSNKKVFIERIDDIKSKKDKSSEDFIDLGNSYYNLGELKKAERAYKESIDMIFNIVSVKNLAGVYVDMGEYKKAEDMYFKIIDSVPGQVDIYLKLADLYRNYDWEERRSDRLGILLAGLEKNKESVDIIVALASFYKDNGDFKKSLEYFNMAIEKDTSNEAIKDEVEEVKSKI
uniref:Tetratricopeptide repeat protein n=1 Tax=candidate division CPR3 bacterium TaxID=2268181 RepID=A0A7C4QWT9_UNCC3